MRRPRRRPDAPDMSVLLAGLLLLSLLATLAGCWWLWRGTRFRVPVTTLDLRIVRRLDHTAELMTLVLRRPGWRAVLPLPAFAPGQSIAIQFPGEALRRRYSLARWTRWPFRYQLTIRREAHGRFTAQLFARARAGGRLRASLPSGEFVLPDAVATPMPDVLVMIAGGVGVTPLLAMTDAWLQRAAPHQRLHFVWQLRTRDEAMYAPELQALAARHPGLHVHLLQSRPATGAGQRVDAALLKNLVGDLSGAAFYFCASNRLMDDLLEQLQHAGVPAAQLHYERFGVGALAGSGEWPLQLDGRELLYAGQPTLLAALEEQGVDLDADCRSGSCGRCRLDLHAGEIRTLVHSEFRPRAGEVLACCVVPCGPLQLARPR